LGLTWSVRVAALVNVAIFGIAALVARRDVGASDANQPPPAAATSIPPRELIPAENVWILPLMLGSGAITFFHEVLWTRMLSHVLGSIIHAFGVMVASFLAGIALGGAVGARVARTRTLAHRAFALAQVGCA